MTSILSPFPHGAAVFARAIRSTKEEKPTLGGVRIRQRKRNINVPLDPESFAKSLLEIFSAAKDEADGDVDKSLEHALGGIDQSDLDYNRYADTFFEVVFTGGILGTSSEHAAGEDDELKINILASEATREAQGPYIKFIQLLLRKKPFLVKGLEATLCKLLRQLEFFDEVGTAKLAIATALVFNNKLGPLPDKVMQSLLDDAKVNKGTSLEFLTHFCKEFLNRDPIEELDMLFKRARLDDKMLNFFPQQKRSIDHFNSYVPRPSPSPLDSLSLSLDFIWLRDQEERERSGQMTEKCDRTLTDHGVPLLVLSLSRYFTESGLVALVELNKKRFSDAQLRTFAQELKMLIQEEGTVKDALELTASKIEELKLDEKDVLPVIWRTIMDSVQVRNPTQRTLPHSHTPTLSPPLSLALSVGRKIDVFGLTEECVRASVRFFFSLCLQRSAKSSTQQQTHLSVLKLIKTWMKLFQTHCKTSRQELVLMNVIQVYCYEDQGLLKLYPKIIQMMYDSDVIAEDTILLWYKQGSSPKGRQVFLSDMQPFIAWLQEASEEEEDSSDEE